MEQFPQPPEEYTRAHEMWQQPSVDDYMEWMYADIAQLIDEGGEYDTMPDVVSRHGNQLSDIWEQKVMSSVGRARDTLTQAYELGMQHQDYGRLKKDAAEYFGRATAWAFLYKATLMRRFNDPAMSDTTWGQHLDDEATELRAHFENHSNIAYSPDYAQRHLGDLYAAHERHLRDEDSSGALASAGAILRFVASNLYASTDKFGIRPHTTESAS